MVTRSTARATVVSVLLHGGVAALLVLRLAHPPPESEPGRLTIINAELLLDGMQSAASGPATASRETPSDPSERAGVAAAPPSEPAEIAANALESPPALPPVAQPAPAPAPAPAPVPAPAPAPDPAPALPPTTAREPQVAQRAEQPPAAAARDAVPEVEASPEPAPSDTRVAEQAQAPAEQVASSAAHETAPAGTPIEGRERARIERRFAAWTGSLDEHNRTVSWKDAGQEYTAVLHRVPADGAMGMEHLVVAISTEQNGRKMSTEIRMARLAFSSFAQFVDRWDPNVAIHDDQIDGRFHSNSEIRLFSGPGPSPKFNGKVTLAAHTFDSEGFVNRSRLFPEGVELNVRRIALPSRLVPLTDGAQVSEAQVQRFERAARVTFYPDATFGWQYLDAADGEIRVPLDARGHYLIGAEDVALHVQGVVDGRVLVYTPDDIVIENDLFYASDPRVNEGADDYVGLVAEKTVTIAPPALTGGGDLTVQASIYARRQFAVRSIYTRRSGTLHIYGSLTAGSITATEPRYATKVEFDPRLASARAPGFPLSDRYELEDWSGEWRVDAEPDGGYGPGGAEAGDIGLGDGAEPDELDADDAESIAGDAAPRER